MHPNTPEQRRRHVKECLLPDIDFRPFVRGQFVETENAGELPIRDAFQDVSFATMPIASSATVSLAVSGAREAFDNGPWRTMHARARAKYLYHIADLIEQRADRFALLESINVGRPLSGVKAWDVPNASEVFRYYAGWADKIAGKSLPDVADVRINTYLEPIGVCALIMPWNFPFADLAWKVAPALAAGCTVIVKSAERAPLSIQAFAKVVQDAQLPDGVFNLVAGTGAITGDALVGDRRLDKISFTGSTATAKRILERSASHLPRLNFELGGKSPNLILDDADLTAAADAAMGAMFSVAGQDCGAGSRLLVDESVADQFVQLLLTRIAARIVGDPLDLSTQQGPQIDGAQVARIERYVANALAEGAELLAGGSVLVARGKHCYAPTLLRSPGIGSEIWREEVFGPVAVLHTFKGFEAGLTLANATEYGLAGGIWTRSTIKAERFVRELRAGTAWVNCYGWFDTCSPWGGRRASGYGSELGREGLDAFLVTKSVFRKGY